MVLPFCRGNSIQKLKLAPRGPLIAIVLGQTYFQYIFCYYGLSISTGTLGALLVGAGSFWWMLLAPAILKTAPPQRIHWILLAVCSAGIGCAVYQPGSDFKNAGLGTAAFLAVSSPALAEPITPSTSQIEFNQPAGSTFHLAYSGDLINWTTTSTRTLGIEDNPLTSFAMPVGASGASRQFFSPALVIEDPDTWMPSTLANQILTVEFNAAAPMVFVFDATGLTATWSYQEQSGTATFYPDHTYDYIHYQAYCLLDLPTYVDRYWQFNNMRLTGGTPSEITGTHTLRLYDSGGNYSRDEPGTFTLTK